MCTPSYDSPPFPKEESDETYSQIRAEIAKLEAQAEAARKAEIAGVVGRMKEAIAFYGLSAADLGFVNGQEADRKGQLKFEGDADCRCSKVPRSQGQVKRGPAEAGRLPGSPVPTTAMTTSLSRASRRPNGLVARPPRQRKRRDG
jgi:hypothetical protein